MKMKLLSLIACMALLDVSQARAATFTYTVNSALESGELSGTIQTDCDSCTLFTSDITGWNLNITDAGGQSFAFSGPSGSSIVVLNNNGALTATAMGYFSISAQLFSLISHSKLLHSLSTPAFVFPQTRFNNVSVA